MKPRAGSKAKKREGNGLLNGEHPLREYVCPNKGEDKEIVVQVLGFDGTEVTAKAKYNTYCNLCHKKISKGETVTTWLGHSFMVHQDCGLAEGRMSNQEFREYAKVRKYKNRRKK